MTCKETQELISAYLDRQLAPADISEVRLHLTTCAACRAEEHAVLQLKETLRTVKMPSIPADLLASIEAETIFKPRWWETGVYERRWAPVALSLLVGLGAWLFMHYKIPLGLSSEKIALSPVVSSAPVVAMHRDQEPDPTEKSSN
jgi:predicted anti-sigma-YlaC factor YlaD